jgi:hypothetical protein
MDGDLVLIDALEEVRRDLRLPAGAVDAPRAALDAHQFALRWDDVTKPAAPLAHARARRQHVRPVVLEHRRRVAACEEPVPPSTQGSA